MGSGRPGKFPADVVAVAQGIVVLKAASEDIEYLKPEVGKVVTVEITPTSALDSEPPVGGDAGPVLPTDGPISPD